MMHYSIAFLVKIAYIWCQKQGEPETRNKSMATPIAMPRQGQSVETCVILEWSKNAGDSVSEGDTLFTYETDKASFDFESPVSGTLLATFFDTGADVAVLENVAVVGDPGEDPEPFRPANGVKTAVEPVVAAAAGHAAAAAHRSAPVAPVAAVIAGTKLRVSPLARKRASEKGVVLASIIGSGPGGRIIERDVLKAAVETVATPAAPAYVPVVPEGDDVQTVPLSTMRRTIGDRMMSSLAGSAQLTLNMSANATAMLGLRKRIKDAGEKLGLSNITINDLVSFALVKTLREFPEFNALIADGALQRYRHVHLAVAVDTPRGLMVPVVRNADALSLNALAQAIKKQAASCQEGAINPDDLSGGTITISNLGSFGVESFTPVLNAPQVALLGVGAIVPRPVLADDGSYHAEPHIGLSLTVDHRAVDGAPAGRFLQALGKAIESIDLTVMS
ncbi:MAG: 2-oxo acid dehydrogenase subunit E2 [Chitinivibrionales bacterium]|nr:2-oxo acid dehydrogenase subunit E2 [Chitinivibrionales bacterium]MBD3396167.1 2-oxo acid dehydrogenase subunit E2 [Chitinivibrionales bacterium]